MRSWMQHVTAGWMAATFPESVILDRTERGFRFCEESLELVQAIGVTKAEVLALVDYVYGREAGEIEGEAGDVLITLSALANTMQISLNKAFRLRMARNTAQIDRIRAKHDSKPRFMRGPLPGEEVND